MKKITATIPSDAEIKTILANLAAVAVKLSIEDDEPVKKTRHRFSRKRSGKTTYSVIAEHFTPSGEFTRSDVAAWMEKAGYAPTGASAAMTPLKKEGLIEQIGVNRYRWVAKPELPL